ncbi:uncharacterized protein V6R79_014055 [Siganus canaliculatus]
MDSDDDKMVKKIALREIKLLKQLRHDNLVNLLEVWKRRRRWYLVFEFVERTLLDDLEQNPNGLNLNTCRLYLYQILRAAAFCHQQQVIHRDIKPENILISQGGVVKLCDFGFARTMASPAGGDVYTDYVATRWYRAPELLVGDTKYGKPVDVWAVGCLFIESLTGQPLFPGDSDLDQIYHIVKCFGNLMTHHQELFYRNPVFSGVKLPECSCRVSLEQRFPKISKTALDLALSCLQMDPKRRAQCSELLEHLLFTQDSFHLRILDELNAKIQKDHRENSTLPQITRTPRREKDGNDKNGEDMKPSEDMDKLNRDKAKRDKEAAEEKTPKTKGKLPSKSLKASQNTSESALPTRQTKPAAAKMTDKVAKMALSLKNKPGKVANLEPRKDPGTSKQTKSFNSNPMDASETATHLTDSLAKPEPGKAAASSESRKTLLKNVAMKGRNVTGLQSGPSDSKVSNDANSKPKGDVETSFSTSTPKVPKLSQCSTKESQSSRPDPREVPSAAKPPKTTSESPINSSSSESEQTKASEITTTTGPKMSPSTILSKTSTSDVSAQSSTVSTKTGPTQGTTTPPEVHMQSDLCKDMKPAEGSTYLPSKLLRDLPAQRQPTEINITTRNQPNSRSSLNKDAQEDSGFLTMTLETKATGNHMDTPETLDEWSTSNFRMTTEARTTKGLPKPNTSSGTAVPKTLNVSDKENQEDLATTKTLVTQTSRGLRSQSIELKNNSREVEPNLKSLKPPRCKSLIAEPKTKLGSCISHNKCTSTQKNRFSVESKKKRAQWNKAPTTSSIMDSTVIPDPEPPTTDSGFQNMDASSMNQLEFSSPPPPPPPPSSTPLLFPPSSTSLIPSIVTSNTVAMNHRAQGFHPGSHSLRYVEKPKHQSSICSRLVHQPPSSHSTGSFTAQGSERGLFLENSLLFDRCNHSNNDSTAATKKKSGIHFPELRSSVPPELRGREGKQSKDAPKVQRKDKPLEINVPATESQQH